MNAIVLDRVRNGNAYIASTGKLTLALAGNFRITISNPAGSTKTLFVYSIVSMSDNVATAYGTVYLNPTTGLPSNTIGSFNQLMGSANTTIAVIKSDTNVTALSGGTTLYPLAIPTNRTVFNEEIIGIQAGSVVGINVPFLVSGNAMFRAFFWEE